jgi:hypothetical protein
MSLFQFPFPPEEGGRIEGEIVESVRRMRASELWTEEEERIAACVDPAIFVDMAETETGFYKPMTGLYRNWYVIPPSTIESHRPVIGRAVAFVKKTVRKLVRFYVNRSLERQTGFNQASVSAHQRAMAEAAALRREVEELRRRIEALERSPGAAD